MPIIQNSGFNRVTFLQDNASCHKAEVVMSYLSEQDFEIMDYDPRIYIYIYIYIYISFVNE